MTFNQFAVDGFLGSYLTVNGKIKPYFEVEPRAYRFRLLNGGPSRFYRYVMRSGGQYVKFPQITQSGNFLPVPKKGLQNIDLWVAERSDIIVDFSAFPDGSEIIMSNTLKMRDDGRGEEVGKDLNPDNPANQMLKFIVRRSRQLPALTLPAYFRPLPPLPDLSNLPRKVFKFERKNGQWAINGRFWDPDFDHDNAANDFSPNVVTRDTAELWTLDSCSGGWDHPMHIHFEEGQIISSNGATIAEGNRFRTDIYRLRQNKTRGHAAISRLSAERILAIERPSRADQGGPRQVCHALPQCGARGPCDDDHMEYPAADQQLTRHAISSDL